jgi:hypothetical protein
VSKGFGGKLCFWSSKAGLAAILVRVVTSMIAVGTSYSVTRIIAPLRDARLVLLTLGPDAARVAGFGSCIAARCAPLAIGIVLKAYREDLAALIKPLLDAIPNVSLVPMVALILLLNIDKVLHIFGSHGIIAAVLLTILGMGVGSLVGGANADTRRVLALNTGTRNFTGMRPVAGG